MLRPTLSIIEKKTKILVSKWIVWFTLIISSLSCAHINVEVEKSLVPISKDMKEVSERFEYTLVPSIVGNYPGSVTLGLQFHKRKFCIYEELQTYRELEVRKKKIAPESKEEYYGAWGCGILFTLAGGVALAVAPQLSPVSDSENEPSPQETAYGLGGLSLGLFGIPAIIAAVADAFRAKDEKVWGKEVVKTVPVKKECGTAPADEGLPVVLKFYSVEKQVGETDKNGRLNVNLNMFEDEIWSLEEPFFLNVMIKEKKGTTSIKVPLPAEVVSRFKESKGSVLLKEARELLRDGKLKESKEVLSEVVKRAPIGSTLSEMALSIAAFVNAALDAETAYVNREWSVCRGRYADIMPQAEEYSSLLVDSFKKRWEECRMGEELEFTLDKARSAYESENWKECMELYGSLRKKWSGPYSDVKKEIEERWEECYEKVNTFYVCVKKLDVKSEPSPSSSKLASLNFGESVVKLEAKGEWEKIKFKKNKRGWVNSRFLCKEEDELVERVYKLFCTKGHLSMWEFHLRFNPYIHKGMCVSIPGTTKFQILSKNTGLFTILNNEILYIEFDVPITFFLVSGIAKIVGTYSYVTALGTIKTVPHLKMLWISGYY